MRDLDTGITYINAGTIGAEVHLLFGGTKDTGNGHREAGQAALDVFTEWKRSMSTTRAGSRRPRSTRPSSAPSANAVSASGSRAPSQSAHSDESRLGSLGEEEGVLWRRVIAGQRQACIGWRGTNAGRARRSRAEALDLDEHFQPRIVGEI